MNWTTTILTAYLVSAGSLPGKEVNSRGLTLPGARSTTAKDEQKPAADTKEFGRVLASMRPGTWAEIKTEGYTRELLGGHDILVYSDRAVWDSRSRQVLFIGQDHLRPPPRFISYSTDSNSWRALPTPKWAEPLRFFHGYQNTALDGEKGFLYHHASATRQVHRYDLAKGEWTTLPEIGGASTGHGTALVYFWEMKGLVRVLGGVVHFYSEDKKVWSRLADKLEMGPYHNFAIYSPPHGSVIFGGGNGSRDVYRLDGRGKITRLKAAPVGLGINQSVITLDPVSGDILVLHRDGKFLALDPGADAWQELPTKGMPFEMKGSSHHIVAAPLSSFGVTLFFTSPARGLKVCLYRHRDKD
jgi:hypothetical protein